MPGGGWSSQVTQVSEAVPCVTASVPVKSPGAIRFPTGTALAFTSPSRIKSVQFIIIIINEADKLPSEQIVAIWLIYYTRIFFRVRVCICDAQHS